MLKPDHAFPDEVIVAVLNQIRDGFLFEDLAKKLLQQKHGWNFTPVGGVHDEAVDSKVFFAKNNLEIIQMSIQKTWSTKIRKTITDLRKTNNLSEGVRVTYLTPLDISPVSAGDLSEELRNENVYLDIKGRTFIVNLINSNLELRTIFSNFCNQHAILNRLQLESTKVFGSRNIDQTIIFLKHFVEEEGHHDFVESLVKTHFFFALIGTDPDQEIFVSRPNVLKYVQKAIPNISPMKINEVIGDLIERNKMCHRDDREFREHGDKYCLAYSIRQKVVAWQAHDVNLYTNFVRDLEQQLKTGGIEEALINKYWIPEIVRDGLAEIFRYQGLTFMSFIAGDGAAAMEINLPEVVNKVVKESQLAPRFHDEAIQICTDILYELIWKPTKNQKEYLNAMAKTYSLMFTGKADQQVLESLKTTAKGTIFLLGTDLIIKLLSETFLEKEYQRFTNLIRSLRSLGVKILVNKNIIQEASAHIKKTARWHDEYVKPFEQEAQKNPDYATVVEFEERYSKMILVRAYYYAKTNAKVRTLEQFFSEFLSAGVHQAPVDSDLQNYLIGAFGIMPVAEFVDENSAQFKWLEEQISSVAFKGHSDDHRAKIVKNDAQTVLTVFQLREKHPNESPDTNIFPHKVWWLTAETKIERIRSGIKENFGEMPNMSPIAALAVLANISELEKSADGISDVLSSALGLNMSHFVDNDVLEQLHVSFESVRGMSEGKKRVLMSRVAERLRRGDVRQIQDSIKSIFDHEADYHKVLQPYYVVLTNHGYSAVWQEMKKNFAEPGYRLKLLSVMMDCSMKAAARWLSENGFHDDLLEVGSGSLKLIVGDIPSEIFEEE